MRLRTGRDRRGQHDLLLPAARLQRGQRLRVVPNQRRQHPGHALSGLDNSQQEGGYYLERKTGTGGYTRLAQLPANATAYIDGSAAAGQTYTYRVRAFRDTSTSDYSNEVTSTR